MTNLPFLLGGRLQESFSGVSDTFPVVPHSLSRRFHLQVCDQSPLWDEDISFLELPVHRTKGECLYVLYSNARWRKRLSFVKNEVVPGLHIIVTTHPVGLDTYGPTRLHCKSMFLGSYV
ncbi:hypothetical protein NPIL_132301 [Nephila pilipes]|uniref:Uncharacterized protein n=1 Tax=Nephila pilipes TaxID=299642 RepID=A0A8X6PBW4_NEPPI|nr:hypothetical protein NPIL_132301 [Nephila pilipes]